MNVSAKDIRMNLTESEVFINLLECAVYLVERNSDDDTIDIEVEGLRIRFHVESIDEQEELYEKEISYNF